MMKLFDNPASPYCRKVMVVLHEAGRVDEVETSFAIGSPVNSDQMPTAVNPLGKIPTLVRDEGPALYDSRVICRYFDAKYGLGLYPDQDPWDVLTLEATGDGIMDAALAIVYEARTRPEELHYAPVLDGQWAKVERALDVLNSRWMGHLAGRLDIGHISVGCALGYLDFRLDARNWRKGHDALADWYTGFLERPSMQATIPSA